jgi:protein import protein ZIM17
VSSLVRFEEETGWNKTPGTRLETPGQQTCDEPSDHVHHRQGNKQSAQMVLMFTCGKCDVRSVKSFSKVAYTRGVVLVECPGCKARHLIADNLGWFGEKGTIQDFAKANGHAVRTQEVDGTLELTPEQIFGDSKLAQLTGQCEECEDHR